MRHREVCVPGGVVVLADICRVLSEFWVQHQTLSVLGAWPLQLSGGEFFFYYHHML